MPAEVPRSDRGVTPRGALPGRAARSRVREPVVAASGRAARPRADYHLCSVFGSPNLRQIDTVVKERGGRPAPESQIKPLLAFTSLWIRGIAQLCSARKIPLVLGEEDYGTIRVRDLLPK